MDQEEDRDRLLAEAVRLVPRPITPRRHDDGLEVGAETRPVGEEDPAGVLVPSHTHIPLLREAAADGVAVAGAGGPCVLLVRRTFIGPRRGRLVPHTAATAGLPRLLDVVTAVAIGEAAQLHARPRVEVVILDLKHGGACPDRPLALPPRLATSPSAARHQTAPRLAVGVLRAAGEEVHGVVAALLRRDGAPVPTEEAVDGARPLRADAVRLAVVVRTAMLPDRARQRGGRRGQIREIVTPRHRFGTAGTAATLVVLRRRRTAPPRTGPLGGGLPRELAVVVAASTRRAGGTA